MSSLDRFCKEPCVSVIILNSHPMRCALEILKGIQSKSMTIDFYADRMIIRHSSEDGRTHCKIQLKKRKLFLYSFTPFQVDGKTPISLSVTVGVDAFMQSIKNEKKQDSCFSIYCSYDTISSFILFSQERSGSVAEQQPCSYSFSFEEQIYYNDPYEYIYREYDENSTMTEKDLESNIARFKTGCSSVSTSLKDTGIIHMNAKTRAGKDIKIDLPSAYAVADPQEEVKEDYRITLGGRDLDMLMKLKKLGSSNIIRIYMSIDYPVLFQTLIFNYGTFLLWFMNPE